MNYRILLAITFLFFATNYCNSQQYNNSRTQFSLNDNWRYYPDGLEFASTVTAKDKNWDRIDLPHTWNATDPFDDDATYRRGISWYRKNIVLDKDMKGKYIYLYFEGANQVCDLYVNNNYVGQHKGGYTSFNFDITQYLNFEGLENSIAIQVNNATDFSIPPLSVGYALYGGIYRDLWLIATSPVHFSFLDHGSKGIYCSTPMVNKEKGEVKVEGIVQNQLEGDIECVIQNVLYDAENKVISSQKTTLRGKGGKNIPFSVTLPSVANPKLWSPETPNLYNLVSKILIGGKVVDELSNKIGFRWFAFDPQNGFSLNGSKYVLRGTNRHQDLKGKGSALSGQDHYRDLKIIKDMGCNFLRLAHYPQAQEVLRLADQMGLLIWEEIPVVNNINPTPEFTQNSKNMALEMIRQHYNHPSIILWGSMNEVLLWSKGNERIAEHRDMAYLKKVREFALTMDSTVRSADPTRYSTMAMHMSKDYDKFNLPAIPQVTGWNIYSGWYSGKVEEFGPTMDKRHKDFPAQVIFISEYGAESDPQLNTENPERLDFSGSYQRYYHEQYLAQIKTRGYLAGTAIWNQFDFSQPNIGGTISHINHKGMVAWNRIKKDVYYLYKSNWNPEPMVYIAARDWSQRAGAEGDVSTIDIYSNLTEVILSVNGKKYPPAKASEINKMSWKVKLQDGENTIHASGLSNGKQVSDQMIINNRIINEKIDQSFTNLAINVGSNTQYLDDSGQLWIQDKAYEKGSYGYLSGALSRMNIKSLITNTEDTPLYYSYLDNVTSYRIDVPSGAYNLELNFAEAEKIEPGERIFDIRINGTKVETGLDLSKSNGFAVASIKKYRIDTNGPIEITFTPIKGSPILNGLRIIKL